MRTGASCAVQQALTPDATTVVKQAVILAKRRGHAQVTPLHVANTMLAAPNGLFRAACLESHSHPLQCKALELCFNVALNRLPASSSNPMLTPHSHSHHPSISNALVATFKRAQAHQRRGSIESQQQPILSVKIELEQLIVSILDDPSVSRVMREAGFLSSQVKTNVEKAVAKEPPPPPNDGIKFSKPNIATEPEHHPIRNEDINPVIEALISSKKRKSLAIVGESISTLESTVRGLMDRVDKGNVPESLKEIKLISIPPLYSFCNLHREEVELKIGELTCLVRSLVGKGVVLYLGDLKWISDYKVGLERDRGYYCSVEHMMMEIGRLIWGIGEMGKFWLMGIATFQTYMKCRTGYNNSLESLWGLHPVTIPANSLGLSLVSESDKGSEVKLGRLESQCCSDCSAKLEVEVRNFEANVCSNINEEPTLSILPSWLKDESRSSLTSNNDQNSEAIKKLRHKWNSFCNSAHRRLQGTLALSSPSTSCFSFDQQNPNLIHIQENGDYSIINPLSSNPSSTPNSTSSSDIMEMEYAPKFKEFNAENLNIICHALEKKVPWQWEIIPEVSGTILQCRSGMIRRKDNTSGVKEETWLFFLGPDTRAKEKVSRELAKVVFGSYASFVTIGLSSFNVSSSEECRSKRGRDEESRMSYIERFAQAAAANPHRVFMVEDLEEADYCSRVGIKRAIEKGRIRSSENGEEVGLCDAVIVLCSESLSFRSRDCSPSPKPTVEDAAAERGGGEVARDCLSLDLNISFDHEDNGEDQCADGLRILENVDGRVVFKIQEL